MLCMYIYTQNTKILNICIVRQPHAFAHGHHYHYHHLIPTTNTNPTHTYIHTLPYRHMHPQQFLMATAGLNPSQQIALKAACSRTITLIQGMLEVNKYKCRCVHTCTNDKEIRLFLCISGIWVWVCQMVPCTAIKILRMWCWGLERENLWPCLSKLILLFIR